KPRAGLEAASPSPLRAWTMQPDSPSRRTFIKLAAAGAAAPGATGGTAEEPAPPGQLPKGVLERVGILGLMNSLVELKDGSLLSTDGRVYQDGGKSWTAPRSFGTGVTGTGLLRLQSGALALVSSVGYGEGKLWLSRDEGTTWKAGGPIAVPGGPLYEV